MLRDQPTRDIAILEGRAASGGTWDLFRYPGIRSDSDMHTLGYSFKAWEEAQAIADGPAILRYLRATASEFGIDKLIEYQQQVQKANWCSSKQRWELEVQDGLAGTSRRISCRFLLLCAGYYDYSQGHQPEFPGREHFAGEFLHPQFWPEDLDYADKRVVVIGSGATAVTLVPALAHRAADVTMLQRSPTWLVSRPSKDALANVFRRLLSSRQAYALTRWKNIRMQDWFYRRTRSRPEKVRRMLLKETAKQLRDEAALKDFSPRYDPWDQRLCLVPDGDFYEALNSGRARVVTDEIESLVPEGIRLRSGEVLPADIIVSATGLKLQLMGGIAVSVDGENFDFANSWSYRGMMCSGLPNLVSVFGYINASWTLRADIVADWVRRLLSHMDQKAAAVVRAELEAGSSAMTPRPWIDNFDAGYIRREMHRFPKQGDREPWQNSQEYLLEREQFLNMSFAEEALRYESAEVSAAISDTPLEEAIG